MSDKNIAKKFSATLKSWRKRKDITQEVLAELAGVSTEHIQRIEGRNPNSPRLDTVVKLSKALGIKLSTLLKDF